MPVLPAAIVFDVDGTLYHQAPVRRGMLLRLARAFALRPAAGARTLRALRAYRHAQEALRAGPADGPVAERQLRWAAERTGLPEPEVAACVTRWMEAAPLDLVRAAARPGLAAFLAAAAGRGVALAVLSDYPPAAKLAALGVAERFSHALCAQDADVGAFKPDPRGLTAALARLGVPPARALYVGDRPEVDGEAARRAGVPCVIIGQPAGREGEGWRGVPTYDALGRELFGTGA